MKTEAQKLEELKVTLGAIKIVRARWMGVLAAKMSEIKGYQPEPSDKAAFSAALGSSEVHEAHLNLINLYGVLGAQAEEFEQTLEQLTEEKVFSKLKVA